MRQLPKQKYTPNRTKDNVYELVCVRCGQFTRHKVLQSLGYDWADDDFFGHEDYEIVECCGCSTITFVQKTEFSEDMIYDNRTGDAVGLEEKVKIYPYRIDGFSKIESTHLLPHKLGVVYQETYNALAAESWTIAAMGVRTIIELLCIDKGITTGKLETKINTLKANGVVSDDTADLLHRVRFLGNEAVHTIDMPSREEMNAAWGLVNNLLGTIYVVPTARYRLRKGNGQPADPTAF
jgi:hypothetical protein